jgi:hypothetical protein
MLNLMNLSVPEEPEAPKRLAPPCYGCSYMCASPFTCTHPGGMIVRWDPIRNHSYRLPSIELCNKSEGMCQFYEPDKERGAEYRYMKMKQKENDPRDKNTRRIEEVMAKIDDDNVSIDEFVDELQNLSDELGTDFEVPEEDGDKDDDKDT